MYSYVPDLSGMVSFLTVEGQNPPNFVEFLNFTFCDCAT